MPDLSSNNSPASYLANFSLSVQQENINIQRAGHTVEDWDLLKLKNGEAVVSLIEGNPFLFTMPLYE